LLPFSNRQKKHFPSVTWPINQTKEEKGRKRSLMFKDSISLLNNMKHVQVGRRQIQLEAYTQTLQYIKSHNNGKLCLFGCVWRDSPQWSRASSFTRFLNQTRRRTTVGRNPLDEWSARRRGHYLTTHNTHNTKTFMPPVGFEHTVTTHHSR
jgi:hypothetical protein